MVAVKSIPKYLNVVPYRINFDREEYKKYKSSDGSIFIPPIYKDISGVYPIELSQGAMGKLIIKEIKLTKIKLLLNIRQKERRHFYKLNSYS